MQAMMSRVVPAQTRRAARRMLAAENFIVDKKYGSGGTQLVVVYSTIHVSEEGKAGKPHLICPRAPFPYLSFPLN